MTSLSPLRCTYCGAVSDFSAHETEATSAPLEHACGECDQQTSVWDEDGGPVMDDGAPLLWAAPDPML
jgi:hypothetical protein